MTIRTGTLSLISRVAVGLSLLLAAACGTESESPSDAVALTAGASSPVATSIAPPTTAPTTASTTAAPTTPPTVKPSPTPEFYSATITPNSPPVESAIKTIGKNRLECATGTKRVRLTREKITISFEMPSNDGSDEPNVVQSTVQASNYGKTLSITKIGELPILTAVIVNAEKSALIPERIKRTSSPVGIVLNEDTWGVDFNLGKLDTNSTDKYRSRSVVFCVDSGAKITPTN